MTGPSAQAAGEHTSNESAVRRFDTALGFGLLVHPGDYASDLIVRHGVYETPETDLVTRLVGPGDVCIDGGCHIGYYSCLMAKLAGPTGHVYAVDANPWCCEQTRQNLALNGLNWAEVIQAALGNERGKTPFLLSDEHQTGLSSLGRIDQPRNIISVAWLRLEDFLNERAIGKVRFMKLDVEGAERLVLQGLGKALDEHRIDYILLECYDERLRLLHCSTQDVAGVLQKAGYEGWEYGTQHPSGWSHAKEISSRGDCNYLFVSPAASASIPSLSIVGAWALTQQQLEEERHKVREEEALRFQIDTLNDRLLALEQEKKKEKERFLEEQRRTSATLDAVLQSKGWRFLNVLRRVRNFVLLKS